MLYWCSVTPYVWQRYNETCRSYDKLCVKTHYFNTSAVVGSTVQNPHKCTDMNNINKRQHITLTKLPWTCSSFSQLLDGVYSYVLQFPGHMHMGHYSNTHTSVLYIAHIREHVPKCGTNLPNQTVSIGSVSSQVTYISQPKLSTSRIQPSHRGWFSWGHTPHHSDGTHAFTTKYYTPLVHY